MAKLTIRTSAKNETCSLRVSPKCSHDEPGKVVLCHLNSNYRGVGMKSPDIWGVYGCFSCHQLLDSSQVSAEDQLRGLQETQYKLMQKGLIVCV